MANLAIYSSKTLAIYDIKTEEERKKKEKTVEDIAAEEEIAGAPNYNTDTWDTFKAEFSNIDSEIQKLLIKVYNDMKSVNQKVDSIFGDSVYRAKEVLNYRRLEKITNIKEQLEEIKKRIDGNKN